MNFNADSHKYVSVLIFSKLSLIWYKTKWVEERQDILKDCVAPIFRDGRICFENITIDNDKNDFLTSL